MHRFLFALALVLCLFSAPLHAQHPDDDRYADLFGITGLLGNVQDAVSVGDDVYLAGTFYLAGRLEAMNIVRWNRTTGTLHPLGAGLYSPYYEAVGAEHLALLGGYLYASGYFRRAGDVEAQGLARYHLGTGTWEAVYVGQEAQAFEAGPMAAVGDDLYVFFQHHLRRFTPATGAWADVLDLGTRPTALAAIGTDLYVGWTYDYSLEGLLRTNDGTEVRRIGRFDTRTGTWHTLGAGEENGIAPGTATCYDPATGTYNNRPIGSPLALTTHAGRLYVGGQFRQAGAVTDANSVAIYDPATDTWSGLDGGVRYFTENVYGTTLCNHPGWVEGLTVDAAGRVYIGGLFTFAGTGTGTVRVPDRVLLRWQEGPGWTSTGVERAQGAFRIGDDALLVRGDRLRAGSVASTGALAYRLDDGTAHVLAPARAQGLPYGSITRMRTGPDGALYAYAAGAYGVGTLPEGGLVRWNGRAWEAAAPALDGCNLTDFIFAPDGTLYGGGATNAFTTYSGYQTFPCVARLREGTWALLSEGVFAGWSFSVNALALSGDTLFVGGNFIGLVDAEGTLVEGTEGIVRYDTRTGAWGPVGTGMDLLNEFSNGVVNALALDPDTHVLYAGGNFNMAGGSSLSSLARWDGTRWTGIGGVVLEDYGSTFPGTVNALVLAGGALYAGGTFTHAGTRPLPSLARYDFASREWTGFGDGLRLNTRPYPDVRALVVRGDEVIVGGGIHRSGDRGGFGGLARWDGAAWQPLGSGIGKVMHPGASSDGTVTTLALAGPDLWVGGDFELAGTQPSVGIACFTLPTATATNPAPAPPGEVGLPYPNPARDRAALPVAGTSAARADVFDLLGRRVATIARPAGTSDALWLDTAALPAGVYLMRVEAGGLPVATRRVTVVH